MPGVDESVEFLLQPPGFGLGGPDDRNNARKNLDRLRVPAGCGRSLLQVRIEALCLWQRLLGGENRFGVAGGEVLAVFRGARLDNHRVALDGARHIQGALDAEIRAGVVDRMDAGVVPPNPGVLVPDGGPVLPAVPELARDVKEFRSPLIPQRVGRLVLQREVPGRSVTGGGHDVPPCPAAADVIHGGEPPGQVVGVVVGGGGRRDEPDAFGDGGDGRQQYGRLEAAVRALSDVAVQYWRVREEDRVERSAFRGPGKPLEVGDVGPGEAVAFRQPPRGFVVPGAHEERVQVQLPCAAHSPSPGKSAGRTTVSE